MGRKRSIWRRGQNGHWYTTVRGKQIHVADKATSYDDAWSAFCSQYRVLLTDKVLVKAIFQRFLAWCEANRTPATYAWYRGYVRSFSRTIPNGLAITKLRKYHVQEWLDGED